MNGQNSLKTKYIHNKTYLYIVIAVVFLVLSVILLRYHETWIDEIQAWELQKNNNIFQIYSHCKTEGHPMLWYLILKPFTMLGFPIKTMNVISILFMTIAVYLFIRYIRQNIWVKLLVVFGGSMFYYNAVNARTYSLVCLAMTLVAITYDNRKEHPYRFNLSLLLLTQTHILTCGFIAGFWIVEVYEMIKDYGFSESFTKKEARNRLYGLLIYSFGILWLLCQLAGIGVNSAKNEVVFSNFDTVETMQKVIVSIIIGLPNLLYNMIESTIYQVVMIDNIPGQVAILLQQIQSQYLVFLVAIIMSVLLMVHLWNTNKQKLFIVYLGVLAANLISYFITGMNISRLLVIVSSLIIIQTPENDKKVTSVDSLNKVTYIVMLVILAVYGWAMAFRETYCTFGMDVRQVSECVNCIDSDDTIVLLDEQVGSGAVELVQNVTGKPFYYPYINSYKTYLSLVGYKESDYEQDVPKPISDLVKFVRDNNIDPNNLVVPIFSYQELPSDSISDRDDYIRYKAIQDYFDIEYQKDLQAGQFVMQLDNQYLYLLRPNQRFIDLITEV